MADDAHDEPNGPPGGDAPDPSAGPRRDHGAGDDPREPTIAETLPGLARIGFRAGLRTLQWAANETLTTGEAIASSVAEGQSPVPVVREAGHEAWTMVARTLGLDDGEDDDEGTVDEGAARARARRRPSTPEASAEDLRARGAALLRRSADVRVDEDTHPAFSHILDDLTPDEARMLRFLSTDGPQPSVDVRTNRPFGVGSELVAGGLSMIGLHAGVRHQDRTQSYLNNLHRLGLIWFSREPVEPTRYQVVEVQPEVTEALARAGRVPKTVRRSIHLTPFGEDFCAACLPTDPPGDANRRR